MRKMSSGDVRRLVDKSVRIALRESAGRRKYIQQAVYVVFDGTSNYPVYGMDVEDEIENNDVEVVGGPFPKMDDRVDAFVERLNDEAMGTNLYR